MTISIPIQNPGEIDLTGFLLEYPLYKKLNHEELSFLISHDWQALNLYCKKCDSEKIFDLPRTSHKELRSSYSNEFITLLYACQACNSENAFFIKQTTTHIEKVGQDPAYSIKVDPTIQKFLGGHHKDYKKGLISESQSYGLGAFAYYRRIIEVIINDLMDDIEGLIPAEEKESYLEVVEKAKKDPQTSNKINLIKDLLPAILRPGGHNPLGLLFAIVSEGLHSLTDEECLERAEEVKKILIFLIKTIETHKNEAKEFTSGMRSLLDKKSKK